MVPSYNTLYDKDSFIFDSLSKKDFIKRITINNYKIKKGISVKPVYFDMTLFTK
jgi:hypothetical protein